MLSSRCGGFLGPALLLLASVAGSGCRSAVVPGTPVFVAPAGILSSETSIAFSPGATGGSSPATIVQFNDFSGGSLFGWSWSVNGTSWSYCNATTPGCGGAGVAVPLAPNQANWRGDPGVAAAPDGSGIVVATQLANSIGDSGNPDMVVASLSFDGGRTFVSTVQVNSQGCSHGDQDQQNIAVDATTSPPTFWFVWRHNGAGTYGACVRGGTVNPATRTISWLGSSEDVENLDRTPFWGVGGLAVQAGGGALTVAYSNTDHIFSDCSGGKQVRWFTVTSVNNGIDWSPSTEVYDSRIFGWCSPGDRLLNSLRAFGFVRDSTGAYWMALADSPTSVRVFASTDRGATWSQTEVLATGNGLLHPAIAADPMNRIGVSVVGLNSAGNQVVQQFASTSRDRGGTPAGRIWWRLQPASGTIPVPPGTASRVAGDFNGAAGVQASVSPASNQTFAAAYADVTTPPGARVAVVYVQVTR